MASVAASIQIRKLWINEGRKEGRKLRIHINSGASRPWPGLIGCTDSIQVIKTIYDKMCSTDNIQLPHELLHDVAGAHDRALHNASLSLWDSGPGIRRC